MPQRSFGTRPERYHQDVSQILDVCKDLVLYDAPHRNLFRELIPLTQGFPVLLEIIIANSALRMSNAYQQPMPLGTIALSKPGFANLFAYQQTKAHNDALVAKHRGLYLLQLALTWKSSIDIDVTLAVVLLFIEFELLDSARDDWACHISGARTIIETLCGPDVWTEPPMSPLRSWLISNCLIFDILGSTLARPSGLEPSHVLPTGGLCLLQDAEGNHCSSFPTCLLQLMQNGARLLRGDQDRIPTEDSPSSKQEQALILLQEARSFDSVAWAENIQSRSPASDLSHRTHVASGHCAAICIYLTRVALSLNPYLQLPNDLETLVAEVINHLSYLHPGDALFTATTWPAFIAGAETCDPMKQRWLTKRFQDLWLVEPWGTIRGALGLLQIIWKERNCMVIGEDESPSLQGHANWIEKLRAMDADWLII